MKLKSFLSICKSIVREAKYKTVNEVMSELDQINNLVKPLKISYFIKYSYYSTIKKMEIFLNF